MTRLTAYTFADFSCVVFFRMLNVERCKPTYLDDNDDDDDQMVVNNRIFQTGTNSHTDLCSHSRRVSGICADVLSALRRRENTSRQRPAALRSRSTTSQRLLLDDLSTTGLIGVL